MKIENGNIVEATESELFDLYLKSGIDDLMDFHEYKRLTEKSGCVIVEN